MKLDKYTIQQLASNIVFSLDWMEFHMNSVQLLAEAGLIPEMKPGSEVWQNQVENFCQKVLGLDEIDYFLVGFWGYDRLCNGLYHYADALRDLTIMTKYFPEKVGYFTTSLLMERRRKVEGVYYNTLPY